jgi:hypothetical protein
MCDRRIVRLMPELARRENRSTRAGGSWRIDVMFRHAFVLAASAVADAPEAAVLTLLAVVDGVRS